MVDEPDLLTVDVIVIGAGPVGENVSDRVVQGGLSAAVVESELVGGECSYWACMPSKALLRSGQVLRAANAVPGAREAITGSLDTAAVLGRRDAFASHYDDRDQVASLGRAGVTLVRGSGRITGPRRVEVSGAGPRTRVLLARHAVVVATGSAPVIPPIDGLAAARPWTNRQAKSAKQAPRRLAVLGGGVIATEVATAWRDLGSEQVVVLERGPRLLARVEPFAGEAVKPPRPRYRRAAGVGVSAVRRPDPGGLATVILDDGDQLVVDEILVAAGRRPRTDDIGLETLGLEPGATVEVDDTAG
jgi:dihydrolipoamide dehydrogenase